MHTLDTTIILPAQVHYTYYAPKPGAHERGTGIPLEPDTPGSIEIANVTIEGVDVLPLLPKAELNALEERLLEDHEP